MKKVALIIATIILLSITGNCQWYHRRYGVNDINQLSKEQLNEALRKAKGGARVSGLVSLIGGVGIISGIVTLSKVKDREDEGKAYTGVFLTGISIPLEITGLTIWGIHGTRKYNIKNTLKNSDIKVGLINNPSANLLRDSKASLVPGVCLKFNFF
jgi:hypothetical protein